MLSSIQNHDQRLNIKQNYIKISILEYFRLCFMNFYLINQCKFITAKTFVVVTDKFSSGLFGNILKLQSSIRNREA